MKNTLIVFSGKAQSGKSTSSKVLKEALEKKNPDLTVEIVSFATKLREVSRDLFGWDGNKELFYTGKTETETHVEITEEGQRVNKMIEDGHTGQIIVITPLFKIHEVEGEKEVVRDKGRQLLINVGQQMRWIRPTVWVDYVMRQIEQKNKTKKENLVFIIDDMRFLNEKKAVKNFPNCFTIRLNRPKTQLNIQDISETDLDNEKFDFYIENNEDIDDLKNKLNDFIYKIS